MPIVRILTDTANAKEKLLVSVDLKKPVQGYVRSIAEKSKIKTPDIWSVADVKKAEKEKDPTRIVLKAKLDPKSNFDKQGVTDKGFVYVKKKGSPPNDPDAAAKASPASPSASSAASPPPPAPAPEAPAPPPPPTAAPPAPAPPAPAAPPPEPPAPKAAPPPPAPAPKEAPAPPAPAAPAAVPPPPEPQAKAPPPAPPAAAPAAPSPPTPVVAPAVPQAAEATRPPSPAAKAAPLPAAPKVPLTPQAALPKSPQVRPPPVPVEGDDGRDARTSERGRAPRRGGSGSAVQAFIEELATVVGPGERTESEEGEKLGALMTELSTKAPGEREMLRDLGRGRSRSPISRWAMDHRSEPAAHGMLEVAGLIESIERRASPTRRAAPGPGPARSAAGPSDRAFAPVADFLHRIGLEKYEGAFADAEFDYDTLLDVTEKDLMEVGVALGARKRIFAEIERVKGRSSPGPAPHGQPVHQAPAQPQPQPQPQPQYDQAYDPGYHHAAPTLPAAQPPQYGHYQEGGYAYQAPYPAYGAPPAPPAQAAAPAPRDPRIQEEVERAMRRDKDLERRWEEVCIMHGSHDNEEWDRRWDAARRYDYHEMNRWRGEAYHGMAASPPIPSRHAVLKQRLSELQDAGPSHAAAQPNLPPNWQVFYTAQGVPYYYNRTTNTTQWHAPQAVRSTSPTSRSRSPLYRMARGPATGHGYAPYQY